MKRMEHIRLLNQIRDRKNIEKAFQYARYNRLTLNRTIGGGIKFWYSEAKLKVRDA